MCSRRRWDLSGVFERQVGFERTEGWCQAHTTQKAGVRGLQKTCKKALSECFLLLKLLFWVAILTFFSWDPDICLASSYGYKYLFHHVNVSLFLSLKKSIIGNTLDNTSAYVTWRSEAQVRSLTERKWFHVFFSIIFFDRMHYLNKIKILLVISPKSSSFTYLTTEISVFFCLISMFLKMNNKASWKNKVIQNVWEITGCLKKCSYTHICIFTAHVLQPSN